MSGDKLCLLCGVKLPSSARHDARYCSARCRVRACRKRKSSCAPPKDSESAPASEPPGTAADPPPGARTKSSTATALEYPKALDDAKAKIREWAADAQQRLEQRLTTLMGETEAKLTALVMRYAAEVAQKGTRVEVMAVLPSSISTAAPTPTTRDRAPDLRLSYHAAYKGEPAKPEDSEEVARRKRLQQAIHEGYNPVVDVLAFAKLEEIQAFDRLARWQAERGLPLTVRPIPPGDDREYLAAVGALQERGHYYHRTPLPERRRSVTWVRPGWKLDSESETDLLRQIYARVESKLRIPPQKGGPLKR